jgi:hypothetical protein
MGLRGRYSGAVKWSPTRRIAPKPPAKPIATPERTRPGAEYMRRYRQRQAAGVTCVTVELDQQDLETLIEAKTLDPRQDVLSREAVGQALKDFLRLSREA